MLPSSSVPHLSYDQLRRYAEAFLARYHASKRIPIPIERIVEFELELDIIPVPGLEEAFEIVGFTSSDLSEITVHKPEAFRMCQSSRRGGAIGDVFGF